MKQLLIIDDDHIFSRLLAKQMEPYIREVVIAADDISALALATSIKPEWIILDLNLGTSSGLSLITPLLSIVPSTKIVVLTGYAGISTAVEAIKLGATYYLAKPINTSDIIDAFGRDDPNPYQPILDENVALRQAENNYILKALERNQRNISKTARELKMHRRTLQRKLEKIRP